MSRPVTARIVPGRRGPQLELHSRLGPAVRLELDDVPPWRGELLPAVVLPAAEWLALARPDRCRALRHLRWLLVPGGVLRLAGAGSRQEELAAALAGDAWLCGFADAGEHDADDRVLCRPERARPAGGPLVSILIPAYKPEFFREALASALAQTHPRCEIVVSDDSPGGEIAAVTAELAGPDGRAGRHPVRYVRNPETLGGRGNYLRCFALARGDYVKFLNDDDCLAPGAVARMAAVLDALPGVTLVTSYRRLVGAAGEALPDEVVNTVPVGEDAVVDGRAQAAAVLLGRVNVLGEPTTVLFRRADLAGNRPHLLSYGGRSARRNGDLHAWTTLLSRGDVAWFTAPLSDFRRHERQTQRSGHFRAEAERAWDELIADADATGLLGGRGGGRLDPWSLPAPERNVAELLAAAERSLAGEDPEAARRYWQAALLAAPRHPLARNDAACGAWLAGRRHRAVTQVLLALLGVEAGAVTGEGLAVLLENAAAMLRQSGRLREADRLRELLPAVPAAVRR